MTEYSIAKIDGVEVPAPSDFTPLYEDYDSESSGRSETWIMTRDIVRRNVRQMSYTWRVKTPELRKLIAMIEPASVELEFFDVSGTVANSYSRMTCYATPKREPKLLYWNRHDPEESWWEITVQFTEY